jgi:hypothetical protein
MAQSIALQAYFPPGTCPPAPAAALQLKSNASRPGVRAFPVTLKRRHGGMPLPSEIQARMEQMLGADLSKVRVHIGQEAPSIGALAFTWDSDIHFAPGRYNPHSPAGRFLLGHELAHVVQQRQGRVRNPLGAGVAVVQDQALEAEADRFGRMAASFPVAPSKVPALQPRSTPVRVQPVPVRTLRQRRQQSIQPLFGYDIWGTATQVANYAATGATGALGYARDAVTGTANYVNEGVRGALDYGRRAVTGPANFVAEAVGGTLRYGRDAVVGTARFLGGIPGAAIGAPARVVPRGGVPVRIRARRGGVGPLLGHLGGGIVGAARHLYRGVAGPLGFAARGATDLANFVGEGFQRPYQFAARGLRGVGAHLTRGATGSLAYGRQGYQALANNMGYFRAAALGFGAVGALGATATGVPLLYGASAAAIPYAFDALNLAYMTGYQALHDGYHSVEYHSAWHSRRNLRARRHGIPGGNLSHMRNLLGIGWRNRFSNTSSAFRTENWHRYSKNEAIKRLRLIDPAAQILRVKPNPQRPGQRFTIQYPGWDTGITHDGGSPQEGVRTEYVFSNFIRPTPPGPVTDHQYFLVQHFPQTVANATNFVVNTSDPIGLL